jgi:predicted RNA binding protein YcfA (HicA-like mRNA interferase family)
VNVKQVAHREHRDVARAATRRGWLLERTGGDHFRLVDRSGSHTVTFSGTPSRPSPDRIMKQVARCESGECVHDGSAVLMGGVSRAERIAAAKARAERQAIAALELAAKTTTHTLSIGTTLNTSREPVVAKVKRSKGLHPKRVSALRWAERYRRDRIASAGSKDTTTKQSTVTESARKAGHSWPTARWALLEIGCVLDYRGRNGSWWTFPDAGAGLTTVDDLHTAESAPAASTAHAEGGVAMVHASTPVSGGESLPEPHSEINVEWGRLEGMALAADAILGKDVIAAQVDRVRRLVDSRSHDD